MDRDGVHAAQVLGEGRTVAQPEMQRRLAVARGRETHLRHLHAQFAIVVDLAVGDQRRRAGIERLVAGREIDDGESRLQQGGAGSDGLAGAVRPAMRERGGERLQNRGVGCVGARREHQSGDAAHQRRPAG